MATPGHTMQDVTTLVRTGEGLVACTHMWWPADGAATDPLAEGQALLDESRARLLALETALVVPRPRGTLRAPSRTGCRHERPGPRPGTRGEGV
jgi:hypothetical protein